MSDRSSIEWTDATWNTVTGCTKVSDGCSNCYIERTPPMRMAGRRFDKPGVGGTTGVLLHEDRLPWPLKRRKPSRVFVNSMADLFHRDVPRDHIVDVFAIMAGAAQHTFQVLTKRSPRMRGLMNDPTFWREVGRQARHFGYHYDQMSDRLADGSDIYDAAGWLARRALPNVWLGVSTENQATAERRLADLMDTPAAVRWASAEPLLGPVDLGEWLEDECPHCWGRGRLAIGGGECPRCDGSGTRTRLDWVVAGGESGPGARPMHPNWARFLRDQCQRTGVPFLFKQWGEWGPAPFVVRVCDPAIGWKGTDAELVEAKRRAEAQGATHVMTGNTYMQDGREVWHIHEMDHKPWSLERAELPDGNMAAIRRWGKKAAGRELDGRTWDEYPASPKAVAA